jgi:plastocyanin
MRGFATVGRSWRLRHYRRLTGAARLALAAGVPAVIVPAQGGPHPAAPPATAATILLAATPAHPHAGRPIHLVVLHPPPAATDYRWDVGGDGVYPLDTGAVPQTAAVFPAAGSHDVSVRVSTPAGSETAGLTLVVAPAAPPASTTASRATTTPARSATHTHSAPPTGNAAVAHAAGDPGVTIADFKFAPGTTTVHAGETISWTNDGPSPHTATANDGSFDTGTLGKGQSGSHTFTQPGTFSYFCRVHPFMHGTVVVLASASTTPTTSTPTTTTTPAAPTTSTQPSTAPASTTTGTGSLATAAPTLPRTGMNLADALVIGLVLLGAGLTLRRLRWC